MINLVLDHDQFLKDALAQQQRTQKLSKQAIEADQFTSADSPSRSMTPDDPHFCFTVLLKRLECRTSAETAAALDCDSRIIGFELSKARVRLGVTQQEARKLGAEEISKRCQEWIADRQAQSIPVTERPISDREMEILELHLSGLKLRQIVEKLNLSSDRVRQLRTRAARNLGISMDEARSLGIEKIKQINDDRRLALAMKTPQINDKT